MVMVEQEREYDALDKEYGYEKVSKLGASLFCECASLRGFESLNLLQNIESVDFYAQEFVNKLLYGN
jgi:hypothetical protein